MVRLILFLVVVLVSNIVQCVTGFAGTVLAMPFSVRLIGFDSAKTILNILGLTASVGVVATNRKSFNKKEFIKLTVIMLLGMTVGFFLSDRFAAYQNVLYKVLGVLVLGFTVLGCVRTFSEKEKSQKGTKTSWLMYLTLAAAGIVHGMFVCGGPLLVVYASQKLKDKDEFRTTVSAMWIVLNGIMMIKDAAVGNINGELIFPLCISLAVLGFAIFLGNMVAKKINKTAFSVVTYVLMAISAVSLLIK